MIDVASAIKLECSVESNHRRDIAFIDGIRELLLGEVEVVHVGGVVLAVVQLHDLGGDDGLEGVVVVWEVRQSVLAPVSYSSQAGQLV